MRHYIGGEKYKLKDLERAVKAKTTIFMVVRALQVGVEMK